VHGIAKKSKGVHGIAKKSINVTWSWKKRTSVLTVNTLFMNCKLTGIKMECKIDVTRTW